MSGFDKVLLGVPALAGGVPILLNLWSTITVLFLVVGFYLGISAAVEESQLKTALAAVSGLVALGGFIMTQWVKYQRQSLKHQKELADNVYYRNVNNNAGIFDYIIGAAEEQECKEAFLRTIS
jgi:NADH:ubiquinone oxidoreductase subunit 6 (subunit J)